MNNINESKGNKKYGTSIKCESGVIINPHGAIFSLAVAIIPFLCQFYGKLSTVTNVFCERVSINYVTRCLTIRFCIG